MRKALPFGLCLFCLMTVSFSACSLEKNIVNTIGMELVLIPAGTFMMGCDRNFINCYADETPPHQVNISKAFYLGKYEVTQAEWESVMGSNPSHFRGATHPVDSVSWDDAHEFIRRLNQKEGTDKYRLPTEAEWEFAATAGTKTEYFFGSNENGLDSYAWYWDNSDMRSRPAGEKNPNPYGLHDIYGNVSEWVQDWYGDYPKAHVTDPEGPSSGESRVLRGGCWRSIAEDCRSTYRFDIRPDYRNNNFGFRIAFSAEP